MSEERDYKKEPYTILCFGDSNTWGYVPKWEEGDETPERYPRDIRWTGLLQKNLGDRFAVVEEGMIGRTTLRELPKPDGSGKYKIAKPFLPVCLLTHRQLDMIILMLGTNDLHSPTCPEEPELGTGVRELIQVIDGMPKAWRNGVRPRILLIAPTCVRKAKGRTELWKSFGEEGLRLSHLFGKAYRQVAEEMNTDFLDAGEYILPSEADGIHWTAEGHREMGKQITEKVKQMLEER